MTKPAKSKKVYDIESDAYKRNQTDDPTTPEQPKSSDAYERNSTHDPNAEGHPQESDAYERETKLKKK
jgi:hypothetical protein